MQKVQRWRYHGMVRSNASWARVARETIKGLSRLGAEIELVELEADRFCPDVSVSLPVKPLDASQTAINLSFEDPRILNFDHPGPWTLMTVTETTKMPTPWFGYFGSVDRIVVPSQFVAGACHASGIPADKIRVVPHGFDQDAMKTVCGRQARVSDPEKMQVLFVGSTARRKGLDTLLEAWARLADVKDKLALCLKLTDYQDVADRPYVFAEWRERVAALRQSSFDIELIDSHLSDVDVYRLMRRSDVLCQPHRGEGFCLPVLEAAAAGCAIVTTNWGGPLDFLDDDSALLLPATETYEAARELPEARIWPKDAILRGPSVAAVAEAIRLLLNSQRLREDLGRQGCTSVSHMTWDHSVAALVEACCFTQGADKVRQ